MFQETTDLAAMAEALSRSADYRVLRRLVPRPASQPTMGQECRTGILLDTETTGLDQVRDEIIELGMVKFDYTPDCISAWGLDLDRHGVQSITFNTNSDLKGSRTRRWGSLFDQHSQSFTVHQGKSSSWRENLAFMGTFRSTAYRRVSLPCPFAE
jgi:hypothetical protein